MVAAWSEFIDLETADEAVQYLRDWIWHKTAILFLVV